MRKGDQYALRGEDVDFDRRVIFLPKTKIAGPNLHVSIRTSKSFNLCLFHLALQDRKSSANPEGKEQTSTPAKEAVTFARERIFEREAVADEGSIMRDALRRSFGEASCSEVRAEFDGRREAGSFRSVQAGKYDSGRKFTTPETIAAERANVAYVLDGRNTVAPILSAELAREQANTRSFLNDSQRNAIEQVLNSTDRVHGLQGLAGSGKTTTLQTIRRSPSQHAYSGPRQRIERNL